ncbi:MAG: hypothetical protein BWY17_03873 [Deltaproteobacteria bacterium ADurb.Bin207]|jgi:hypothetical protein|nr:MAG: hypothetical protein BWY17_03873 [Deltaproteobacteria bacterium ADurb.Bin207]
MGLGSVMARTEGGKPSVEISKTPVNTSSYNTFESSGESFCHRNLAGLRFDATLVACLRHCDGWLVFVWRA